MDITDIVNDKYWLAYAKRNIDAAEASLKDSASTLNKLIATFWGIYTAAFTAGAITGKVKVDHWWQLMFFILPIPLLIAGYIVTTYAQIPGFSTETVDPRIPEDIQTFYNNSIKAKRKQLKGTFFLIAAAGLSLTIALCLLNATNSAPGKPITSSTPTQSVPSSPVNKPK